MCKPNEILAINLVEARLFKMMLLLICTKHWAMTVLISSRIYLVTNANHTAFSYDIAKAFLLFSGLEIDYFAMLDKMWRTGTSYDMA